MSAATWTKKTVEQFLAREPQYLAKGDRVAFYAGMRDEEFDVRWRKHHAPQATDQFWKTLVDPTVLEGKTVLDAGCGIGRYSRDALDAGAQAVLALDIADHAIKHTVDLCPEALVVQADLADVPVAEGVVDFAFSIGVLHHTPDPAASFAQVAKTVRPGGLFAVWVYEQARDPVVAAAMELLHEITRICPREALHAAIEKHALRVRDLYRGNWAELQQVVRVSNSVDDEECVSDTYDWHAPRWRYGHTEEEVRSWFETAGFDVLTVGSHAVNVLGRKRAV